MTIAIGWGSIGLWVHELPLTAIEIATYRFLGAGCFLMILSVSFKKNSATHLTKKELLATWVCGSILSFQFLFTIIAYQTLMTGEATILTNLHLIILIIASPLFLKRWSLLFSFSLAIFLLILGLHLLFTKEEVITFQYSGIFAGIFSSILFGLYTLLTDKYLPNKAQDYLWLIFVFGSIPLLTYLFFTNEFHFMFMNKEQWIKLNILLIFSTILTHMAYLMCIKRLGSLAAGIMSYFAILIAFLIDFFLGKHLTIYQWLGAFLIFFTLVQLHSLQMKNQIPSEP